MGFAFRLMMFTVMLNLAVGMITWVGGGLWHATGMVYNENQASPFISDMESQFNQSMAAPVESSTTFGSRILDFLSIGFFSKIKNFLHSTIFAIPNLLTQIGLIPSGMMVFLDGILTIVYILGMFEIFTWRDLSTK